MFTIVNSYNKKRNQLRNWILKDITRRGLNDTLKELQKEHQDATEEKDSTIPLLSDGLQDVAKRYMT